MLHSAPAWRFVPVYATLSGITTGAGTTPEGGPLECRDFQVRVWSSLVKRADVTGTFHAASHACRTALTQSGENAKTVLRGPCYREVAAKRLQPGGDATRGVPKP